MRHNIIRHAAAGFNISGYDDEHSSQQTQNIDIVDNLVYDIGSAWGSSSNTASGMLAVIGNGPKDITIDHNTVDNDGGQTIGLYAGKAPTGTKIYGFVLTNNLLRNNSYGVFGDTIGTGSVAFSYYTPNAVVLRNTFAGGSVRNIRPATSSRRSRSGWPISSRSDPPTIAWPARVSRTTRHWTAPISA